MSTMKPLLIELGTEELPVKALQGLAQAFFDGILDGLRKRGVMFETGDAKPLYTPRRIAVLLPSVAAEQPEQRSEVLGPYLNIALDADGQPTRALQGFAAKAGIDWTHLERTSDAKGERFVHRAVTPGATTAALLGDIVREAIAAMPIPKPMRWGAHAHAFARPVHWLVLLLGDDVVDAEVLGVRSGRQSRGHRFMHAAQVAIASPAAYVDGLRDAHVIVDPDARRASIVAQVHAAAQAVGGVARIDAGILEEVNGLTESPHAITCSFEREFLAVPQAALIATMETNQKFFPVLDANGALTEHFVAIANIASRDEAEVRKGYERVIRPRFSDAKFFFDEDMKQGLSAMGAGLSSVTYQARLGTVADKVARVAALAQSIAAQVGVDPVLAERAAQLSKNDLQSRMVGEFPELQGIAGRHYALHDAALHDLSDAQRMEVATAIDEAYMPRFAGDAIAPSTLGQVLAIAERLDTLAGGFAAGLKPTGNKDPFALRRNALGLARTLLEGGHALSVSALLDDAHARQPGANSTTAGDLAGLTSVFVYERLRGYYADRGVTAAQFDAVDNVPHDSLPDFDARISAIGAFAALPEAAALAAANKRIRNILRKVDGVVPTEVDPALFAEDAERALDAAVNDAARATDVALESGDYVAVLTRLAQLRPQVDAFFDRVMVNVDDMAVRNNRLALLHRLSERLGSVAAIEHLSA